MNRRDTIIVAVLINSGLLAILFMMAIHPDGDSPYEHPSIPLAISTPLMEEIPLNYSSSTSYVQTIPADEVDNAIKAFVAQDPLPLASFHSDVAIAEPIPTFSPTPTTPISGKEYTEVKVKRGDFLERIARNNGTTVKAIMQANGLTSERLNVGQVLRVPGSSKAAEPSVAVTAEPPKKTPPKLPVSENDSDFYVVQRGDNPWKIAKKFQVRFEDLLILNDLDEDKARNLKVGDKLRVR
ncbi:MAG: hypothetical protein CK425_02660 [Parachlamydia sp.]|nr:MAG: hypothetical protein CK425_02660 [Parachlamydia sp.]